MLIRKMTSEDICFIAAIERQAFGNHAWSEGLFADELSGASKHYFVAVCGGVVCGYGGFAHIIDEAHIMNIAVDKSYRKQGIGFAVLQEILGEAKTLDVRAVTLEVRIDNTAAKALYEGAGFILSGIRKDYYGKNEHALIYWLTL